jgi:hypothetical protein
MPLSPRHMVLLLIASPYKIAFSFITFLCAVHLPYPEIWNNSVLCPSSGDLRFTPNTVTGVLDVIFM